MVDEKAINELANSLEKHLRIADDYLTSCPKWAKARAKKQRNAINAACNALHRFRVA